MCIKESIDFIEKKVVIHILSTYCGYLLLSTFLCIYIVCGNVDSLKSP